MLPGNETAIPFADLVASNGEWRDGHSKNLFILSGMMTILSATSSSLLILIIARSRERLSTTYHRLVLGMSISDIIYSACGMTFGAMYPSDMSYTTWNARGSQVTCDAMGFLVQAGFTGSLFYSCSLNLNYLAVVKYSCSETYIRSRIEPFMHAIPIALALIFSVLPLAGKNFNGNGAYCHGAPVYEPPHCTGFEDGQVREGFDIPCGRGREGFIIFSYASPIITLFIPPIIIGVSLGMMYKTVRNQENQLVRYGAGALNQNVPGADDDAATDGGESASGGIRSSIASAATLSAASLARRFGRRATTNSERPARPVSHSVLQRAAAYSFSFFLTYSWAIILFISIAAQGGFPDFPYPNWLIALYYIASTFGPLQGLFNLLIYMQPKVTSARRYRGQDLSWPQAIARAFRTSLGREWSSGNDFPTVDAGRGNGSGGDEGRVLPVAKEETVEVEGEGPGDVRSTSSPAEEEKAKIQGPDIV